MPEVGGFVILIVLILAFVLAVALIFAPLKLFSIDRNLRRIVDLLEAQDARQRTGSAYADMQDVPLRH